MKLLVAWLFALVAVGYPLAAMLGVYLDVDSLMASIPFRVLVIVLSVVVILLSLLGRQFQRPSRLLLAFFIAYLLRLLYDWGVQGMQDAAVAMLWFLGSVALPSLAVTTARGEWSESRASALVFQLGLVACVLVLFAPLLGVGTARSTTDLGNRLSYEALNPISVGHAGALTLLAALARWKHVEWFGERLLLVLGIAVAASVLVLAGSRGPVVAAAAALLFLAMGRPLFLLVLLPLLAIVPFVLEGAEGLTIASRLTTLEDESGLERLAIQINALNQFLEHPWLGSAYAELETGLYPHNFFLESAMALGVFGLAMYGILNFRALLAAWRELRLGQWLLPLLFVETFVGVQLSGAIWGADAYWTTLSLLLMVAVGGGKATASRFAGQS